MVGNASKNPIGHYLRQRGGNRAKAGRKGERTRAMVGVKWCERKAQQHSPAAVTGQTGPNCDANSGLGCGQVRLTDNRIKAGI
jgi:hypothetical protein